MVLHFLGEQFSPVRTQRLASGLSLHNDGSRGHGGSRRWIAAVVGLVHELSPQHRVSPLARVIQTERRSDGIGEEDQRMTDETTDAGEDSSLAPPKGRSSDPPEQRLVECAQQGDHQAFAALFEAYNGRICTYLARLVG